MVRIAHHDNSMKVLLRIQRPLFLAILLIAGVVFAWQAWQLRLLYTDSTTREAARTAMTAAADHQGWLLSDMIVDRVEHDRLMLTYREHRRGTDPETCYTLLFKDSSLHPCE